VHTADGSSSATLFIDRRMLQFIPDAESIHMDGTFRAPPRGLKYSQLATVHIIGYNHVTIPLNFFLSIIGGPVVDLISFEYLPDSLLKV